MGSKPKGPPKFASEAEEREFWESHDSSDYVDWSKAASVRLPNPKPSTKTIFPAATCLAARARALLSSPHFHRPLTDPSLSGPLLAAAGRSNYGIL